MILSRESASTDYNSENSNAANVYDYSMNLISMLSLISISLFLCIFILRSKHHAVYHDVGQSGAPFSPCAGPLSMILQLRVPVFCARIIFSLQHTHSRAFVSQSKCSHSKSSLLTLNMKLSFVEISCTSKYSANSDSVQTTQRSR